MFRTTDKILSLEKNDPSNHCYRQCFSAVYCCNHNMQWRKPLAPAMFLPSNQKPGDPRRWKRILNCSNKRSAGWVRRNRKASRMPKRDWQKPSNEQRMIRSWKNRLKTAKDGWEERSPGTCGAGGPPPDLPAWITGSKPASAPPWTNTINTWRTISNLSKRL